MKIIFAGILFLLFFAVPDISAQTEFCFENKGLKKLHTVSLTITKNKIEGTFEVWDYNSSNSAETFEFTGTKSGNLFTVKFSGTIPYEFPPNSKKIMWTLRGNRLIIPSYGKNYQTNKISAYQATYEKCAAN